MSMYELATTFQCPKCMARITPIVFSTTKPDKETEIHFAHEMCEKHMALHKKAEKYEIMHDCVEKMRGVFGNGT